MAKKAKLPVSIRALMARMNRGGTAVKAIYSRRPGAMFTVDGELCNLGDLEMIARERGFLKPFEALENFQKTTLNSLLKKQKSLSK